MTQHQEDPFAGPAEVLSVFPSVASFRGRLVIIEPTGYEYDVPNQDDPSKKADRVTATVTVVDGSGDVELMPGGDPSGKFIPGPEYRGVWIGQERLVQQLLKDYERGRTHKMVLGRFETFKPGVKPRKGNPWGLLPPTEADKQVARQFLANRMGSQLAAPAAAPEEQTPPKANPFA